MDALLQSAADELYGSEKFDDELYSSNVNKSDKASRPDASTLSVLIDSAAQIAKEDAIEVKQALGQEVEQLKPVVLQHRVVSPETYDDKFDEPENKIDTQRPLIIASTRKESDSERSEDEVGDNNNHSDDDSTDDRKALGAEEMKLGFELLLACRKGDYRSVNDLLRKGASVYYRDRHGWTVVHWAAAKGHDEVVDRVLESCNRAKYLANLQDSISGWTALHVACIGGHDNVVKVLLKHGASRKRINKLQERPIDCASSFLPSYSVLCKLLT